MTLSALALLALSLAAGLFSLRGRRRLLPAAAGVVLAAGCFIAAILYPATPSLSSFRLSLGESEFIRPAQTKGEVDGYKVTLALGELSPSGERWRFRPLGKVRSWRPAEDLPDPLAETRETRRIRRRNCSRTFELPDSRVKFTMGWDSEGGEFLRVEPLGKLHRYLRPFNSYDGVFPRPGEDFAATRLFISGVIDHDAGGVFGLPRGSAAFIVVQPDVPGEALQLDAAALFSELRCTSTPYRFSNNVTSFETARELLLRGTCFPRHEDGVPFLLSVAAPVLLLYCFAAGLGVFAVWKRLPGAGLVLGLFIALLLLSAASRREFDSLAGTLRKGGAPAVYAAAALAAEPLWAASTVAVLEKAADSGRIPADRLSLVLSFAVKKSSAASNKRRKAPENLPSPHNGKN